MAGELVRKEVRNGQLQPQAQGPLTRREKAAVFLRALNRFERPFMALSASALERGGLSEAELARHLRRLARHGTDAQVRAAFQQAEIQRTERAGANPYREAAMLASEPCEVEKQLASGYVKAQDRRSAAKDISRRAGTFMAVSGLVTASAAPIGVINQLWLGMLGTDAPTWALNLPAVSAVVALLMGVGHLVRKDILDGPIERDGRIRLWELLGARQADKLLGGDTPNRRRPQALPPAETSTAPAALPAHTPEK